MYIRGVICGCTGSGGGFNTIDFFLVDVQYLESPLRGQAGNAGQIVQRAMLVVNALADQVIDVRFAIFRLAYEVALQFEFRLAFQRVRLAMARIFDIRGALFRDVIHLQIEQVFAQRKRICNV